MYMVLVGVMQRKGLTGHTSVYVAVSMLKLIGYVNL